MHFPSKFELLAISISQLSLVDAQNCNATSPFDSGFNATGSVQTQGFRVNDTFPASTWAWSQYMVDEYDSSFNKSEVWRTLGLETSPVKNLTDPSLPYTSCIIALTDFPMNNNGARDNGTCNTVFTSACIAEIIHMVNQTASRWSDTTIASADSITCNQLLGNINADSSSACHNQWSGTIASRFLPRNFTENTSPVCTPVTNPGQTNATSRGFFAWTHGSAASDNCTFYDEVLLHPQPIIVAAFLKDERNGSTQVVGSSTGAWSDTRLLCLPGNTTEPGSRNITQAQRDNSAGRGGVTMGMLAVVALNILVGLI